MTDTFDIGMSGECCCAICYAFGKAKANESFPDVTVDELRAVGQGYSAAELLGLFFLMGVEGLGNEKDQPRKNIVERIFRLSLLTFTGDREFSGCVYADVGTGHELTSFSDLYSVFKRKKISSFIGFTDVDVKYIPRVDGYVVITVMTEFGRLYYAFRFHECVLKHSLFAQDDNDENRLYVSDIFDGFVFRDPGSMLVTEEREASLWSEVFDIEIPLVGPEVSDSIVRVCKDALKPSDVVNPREDDTSSRESVFSMLTSGLEIPLVGSDVSERIVGACKQFVGVCGNEPTVCAGIGSVLDDRTGSLGGGSVVALGLDVVRANAFNGNLSVNEFVNKYGVDCGTVLTNYDKVFVYRDGEGRPDNISGYCWLHFFEERAWPELMSKYPPALDNRLFPELLERFGDFYTGKARLIGDPLGSVNHVQRDENCYTSKNRLLKFAEAHRTYMEKMASIPSLLPTNRFRRLVGLSFDETKIWGMEKRVEFFHLARDQLLEDVGPNVGVHTCSDSYEFRRIVKKSLGI